MSNKELIQRWKESGNPSYRDQVILDNKKIVYSVANKFYSNDPHIDQQDLYQIGFIGLIKAVDTFDPDMGYYFSTYAYSCVTNEIRMALRHLPKDLPDAYLDEPVDPNIPDGPTLKDTFPSDDLISIEEAYEDKEFKCQFWDCLKALPERELDLLDCRFGLYRYSRPHTLAECGEMIGVSSSRVREIVARAMRHLRKELKRKKLI